MQFTQPFSVSANTIWFLNSESRNLHRIDMEPDSFRHETYELPQIPMLLAAYFDLAQCSAPLCFLFSDYRVPPKIAHGSLSHLQVDDFAWPLSDRLPAVGTTTEANLILGCKTKHYGLINSIVEFDSRNFSFTRRELELRDIRTFDLGVHMMRHEDDLVLFNVYCGLDLSWISGSRRDGFEHVSTSDLSVVGPASQNGVVFLEHNTPVLKRIRRNGLIEEAAHWNLVPWSELLGVAMAQNGGIVVLDKDQAVYVKVATSEAFMRLDPDSRRPLTCPLGTS